MFWRKSISKRKTNNIEPTWGIYNGSIGTVHEIIFQEGDNPNEGKLPLYVSVERLSYKPPEEVEQFDYINTHQYFFFPFSDNPHSNDNTVM